MCVDELAAIVPGDLQVHLPGDFQVRLLPSVPGDRVHVHLVPGDCQVQEGGDCQVPPGGAEAGKQLEEEKESLATGWRG